MKLLALLALFCAPAYSQVINQMSPGSGPANTFVTILGTGFTGTTQVAVGGVTNGVFIVKDDKTILFTVPFQAGMGLSNITVLVNGKQATGALPFTVTPLSAYPMGAPPRCILNQQFSNWHSGTSAGGSPVYLLFCDDQLGLMAWSITGPPTVGQLVIPPACQTVLNSFSWSLPWLQSAWSLCIVVPLNPDQQAEFNLLWNQWVPRLTVSAGTSQNVYTANADGSKGPQLVIGGFGMLVASGLPCGGNRLLNAGARYADVSGQKSTNNQLLPAGSFALCDITYPPNGGFTN